MIAQRPAAQAEPGEAPQERPVVDSTPVQHPVEIRPPGKLSDSHANFIVLRGPLEAYVALAASKGPYPEMRMRVQCAQI